LRRTRLVLAVAEFALVRAVAAVVVMVTQPSLVDAPSVVTLELIVHTRRRRWTIVQRSVLISAIYTIWIAITKPFLRNTLGASPGLVLLACELCLLVTLPVVALVSDVLVTVVQAIVVSVANVDSRYAISVVTGEQVAEAGSTF
jgi:hypothetical protein